MASPTTGEQVALLQQAYLRDLVKSDEMFNNIMVLAEDEGNIQSQMDIALGIIDTRDGSARGACVVVRQPVGSDPMPGVEFPPLSVDWDFLCLEWRDFNKDTTKGGTGKRAWNLARRIHRITKAHRAPGLIQCLTPRTPAIIRTSSLRDTGVLQIPLVGYTVRMACNEADDTVYRRVANVSLSGSPALTTTGAIATGSAGTVLTVTHTDPDVQIYFTTDLSNPWAENGTLYSGPITTGVATYLFRAFKSGSIGSHAVAASFS